MARRARVDGGGACHEVGEDPGHASASSFSSAVDPAGEVADLAFDFRTRGPIRGLPVRSGLVGLGLLHLSLVAGDADRAPGPRRCAALTQRTAATRFTERCYAGTVSAAHDRRIEIGWAPHDVRVEVDRDVVLRIQPVTVRCRGDLRGHVETLPGEAFAKLRAGLGGITYHFGLVVQPSTRRK